ncbi:ABC transporter ATP-binding protein [Alicyclobacillus sp. SO9]|uniref:ABC transporter ATP-binding protein n=1 Tax=Alicyclobacillus sp. SO9 TaxID=2665646 RepID=UPI0018E8AEB0|nr:ABC transporter ATP-binding protein [Alicyclobacillus sp. SO9]QQE79476.1 ABC transporter ATP-binding protein [Alicyclobacillus sp. SO9]
MDAVTFQHVSKSYRTTTAVANLSLNIKQETVVALLGPNGAGKTTALSMTLGLTQPTSGTVTLLGQNPNQPRTRQRIGAMLQEVTMPDKTSVTELVNLFRSYYEHSVNTNTLLELAQLTNLEGRPVRKLSGGQQRRLQFALAMAGDPRILFLDEPTAGMDITSRQGFWKTLRRFSETEGKTIVFSTHHLDEADAAADRVLLLQNGRLIADGSPAELKTATGLRLITGSLDPKTNRTDLLALPHLASLEWQGDRFTMRSTNSDETLRSLIQGDFSVRDIEVRGGGLEDAFVALTMQNQQAQQTQQAQEADIR